MSNRTARTEEDTTVSKAVGRNVKRLRAARGLSGRQLTALVQAKGFRLGHSRLSRLELGTNHQGGQCAVTVDELVALAATLDVSVEMLMAESTCDVCGGAPPAGFACRVCGAEL